MLDFGKEHDSQKHTYQDNMFMMSLVKSVASMQMADVRCVCMGQTHGCSYCIMSEQNICCRTICKRKAIFSHGMMVRSNVVFARDGHSAVVTLCSVCKACIKMLFVSSSVMRTSGIHTQQFLLKLMATQAPDTFVHVCRELVFR